MGNCRNYLIQSIVDICKRLDSKGFVANHDGNISVKYDDKLLATPTSVSKISIVPDTIITLDMEGNKIEGYGKPFSEIKLHLEAYRSRSDAVAVVHAHPPFSTARGLVNLPLNVEIPEAIISIGAMIPVTPFTLPGTDYNDRFVAEALKESDVFMMPGNGVLAIGRDIEQAYLRIELVEHIAKIDCYARQMGKPLSLSEPDREELLSKRASLGLGPTKKAVLKSNYSLPLQVPSDVLKELIANEIINVMKGN